MLVDTENPPESKPEAAAPAPAHSHLRVRSDLHEEYSSDEIAKMTELYEGTLSNIEEGEIVKSKVLRVTDTAVILDGGVGHAQYLRFDDLAFFDIGERSLVQLRHRRHPRRRLQVGRRRADRRVQGRALAQRRGRGRGIPRASRGSRRRGRPLEEEGRLHAGLGADPRGPGARRGGVRHAGQDDQRRSGGGT